MNRFLAWATSFAVLVLILEVGLRVLGFGPPVRVTEPDPQRGWRNVSSQELRRHSSEFDVRFRFNTLGLRDDELPGVRPTEERRVLMLGDSFVLGYTVAREDHFVDLLEARLNAGAPSGATFRVLNAGVEGYSTDQELLFFEKLAGELKLVDDQHVDVAVLCMYQNDVWWNDQTSYGPARKPRLETKGSPPVADLSVAPIDNAGVSSWWKRTAIGSRFTPAMEVPKVKVVGQDVYAEWSLLAEPPPPEMQAALDRTTAILRAFKASCEKKGVRFLVALIPDKAQVNDKARTNLLAQLPATGRWNPDRATGALADCCRAAGIDGAALLDPLHPLEGETKRFVEQGTPLHYEQDWHFSPEGSRRFAAALAERLATGNYYGKVDRAKALGADAPVALAPKPAPVWPWVLGGIWLVLSLGYIRSYRDEPLWAAPLKVGALLGFVALVFWGVGALAGMLPLNVASRLPVIVVGLILLVVLWSARKRLLTVFELMGAMADRGHWYMVPLLVVLLAIGTLLVAAASNPFVAPFIYTLF